MAARRAYWKGYLKLSLVTCAVGLYPASSQAEKTHFHQINRKTGNRLRQQMVDEKTGKVVDKEHKGRGYELSKGRYVEIEPEELEAVKLESTHTIDIESFVPADEIDVRYYDKPYYIPPDDKSGEEAFAVIRDAMKDKERVALARIVVANREHIMAIELLGTTLRYDYEVRDEKEVFKGISRPRVDTEAVELAADILKRKAGHFDPSKFKDKYDTALKAIVKRKAAGKPIEKAPEPEQASNVIDLMEALKQSLKAKGRHAPAKTARRNRPHRRPSHTRRSTSAHRRARKAS